jgi:hypothetical protein
MSETSSKRKPPDGQAQKDAAVQVLHSGIQPERPSRARKAMPRTTCKDGDSSVRRGEKFKGPVAPPTEPQVCQERNPGCTHRPTIHHPGRYTERNGAEVTNARYHEFSRENK